MSALTIRPRPGVSPIAAPLHADGKPYRYEMVHSAGSLRTYADSPAELVAALIPGYAETTDPVEAAQARIAHAVHVQVTTQAAINVQLGTDGCSPEERALLCADRSRPPTAAQWSAPVPLVLVDCFYSPVTELTRPVPLAPGEILWLRPATDWDHLYSLAGLGIILLAAHSARPEPDHHADDEDKGA